MSFIIHAGEHLESVNALRALPTPEPRGPRHHPLRHEILRDLVVNSVHERGISVREERVALTPDGHRYFGLLTLDNGQPDWAMTLGIRGSTDQSFAEALCGGSRVFVCDNLAFSGEVKVARKSTRYVMRDLPGRVETAIERLLGETDRTARRFEAYRNAELDTTEVATILMDLVITGTLPGSKLTPILQEYEAPRHAEHGTGTAWALFNATTEILKGSNAERLVGRTIRLHEAIDQEIGLTVA